MLCRHFLHISSLLPSDYNFCQADIRLACIANFRECIKINGLHSTIKRYRVADWIKKMIHLFVAAEKFASSSAMTNFVNPTQSRIFEQSFREDCLHSFDLWACQWDIFLPFSSWHLNFLQWWTGTWNHVLEMNPFYPKLHLRGFLHLSGFLVMTTENKTKIPLKT